MDASASSSYARKRLAQLPGLNKKVQGARKAFEGTNPHDADGQVAAAQARVAKLQDTVPTNFKQKAYSDKGGLLSSALRYRSKWLTIDAVKAVLNEPGQQAADDTSPASESGSDAEDPAAETSAAPATAAASSGVVGAAGGRPVDANAPTASPAGVGAARSQHGINREPLGAAGLQTTAAVYTVYTDTIKCSNSTSSHRSIATSSESPATHCSNSSNSASAKSKLQQHCQQQLEMADDLLSKINSFMTQELAVQRLKQQAQAASAPAEPAAAPSAPQSSTAEAAAANEQQDQTGDGQIDLTAEGWTPELIASLAMRFQGYGLPPGVNSMPDIATMIQEVKQEEREEAQKRQHEQQQWTLEQQQKQQAKQQCATRHLQLYQLGVRQQRAKLQRERASGVWPRAGLRQPGAAAVGGQQWPHVQHQQTEQQQQHSPQDVVLQDEGLQLQQQQQQGHGGMSSCEAASPVPAEEPLCKDTAGQAAQDITRSQLARVGSGTAAPLNTDTAQHTAGPSAERTALNSCQDSQQSSSKSTDAAAASQDPKQEIAASSTADTAGIEAAQTVPQMAPAMDSTRAAELLQQLQQKSSIPLKPPVSRYKYDVPGVTEGASHGHLSPAGLKFQHLPGSRRQVYAQVQDALACSEAIKLAEQELRGLHYAQSGASGTGS